MSAYGNAHLRTPNIDRIAEEGTSFMESVCASPVCSPARAAWYTGRTSKESGVAMNSYPLREELPDLGQWLREHTEYDTVYSGKWHVPGRDVRLSFDTLHPGFTYAEVADSDTVRVALSWLLDRKGDKPFFLSVGLLNPHDCCYHVWPEGGPYKFSNGRKLEDVLPPLPENFSSRVAQNSRLTRDWSELDWRFYIYNYYRLTEMVDAEVGRMYDAVRRSRFAENTVFIFSSDHGEGIGHHGFHGKGPLEEEFCRVPLIFSWPGRYEEGARDDTHLVTAYDVPGTICDLAGAPPLPDVTQALSLRPLLEGQGDAPWRDHMVIETSQGLLTAAVRDKRYKTIFGPGVARGFDLQQDPLETRDLSDDPEFAAVIERHRGQLREYVKTIEVYRPPANMKQLLEQDARSERQRKYPFGDIYTPCAEWYDRLAEGGS